MNLICPISKKPLKLIEFESFTLSNGKSFPKSGFYYEEDSKICYPIINCVPVMLTFPTPLTQKFMQNHKDRLKEFALPNLEPMPGEKSIQATFTEEWGGVGDDEFTFAYIDDEVYTIHKDIWLQMKEDELALKKTVLDVGCGFGKEAIILSKIFNNAIVYAIDLNLAVIQAGKEILEKTGGKVVPVVASLFHMPFVDSSFDHVHCQGVAHHTFSTQKAFEAISAKVNKKGSLFLWVYAWEDSFGISGIRGFLIHVYYFTSHRIFRPILSRSPEWFRTFVVNMIALPYHFLVSKIRAKHKDRWKYKNTVHGIRDAFTPRYAHRHRWNEVIYWFEKEGYENLTIQSPYKFEKLTTKRLLGIGVVGRKDV